MKAKEIIDVLNQLAPPFLVDSWDNSGLQIGSIEREIKKILIALDLSENSLNMAVERDVDMIITHHPFLFGKMSNIPLDDNKGKMIKSIIKNDIVVFSMHTNLDMCEGGVNDVLSEILSIENLKPLSNVLTDKLYKLCVFVPVDHLDNMREVLGDSGAGFIGNYSYCTFSSSGVGTFLPHKNTNPYIGTSGVLERVEEEKIEIIVDEHKLNYVIGEMLKAHPYEEVAYDIYPLKNSGKAYGYGRIGDLKTEMKLSDFSKLVKNKLECESLKIYGDFDKTIKRVAVCGGSGSCFISDAKREKADAYVTGDIKYHDAQLALEIGLPLLDAGHYETEKPCIDSLKSYLEENTSAIEIVTFKESLAPFKTL